MQVLGERDLKIAQLIEAEQKRQRMQLSLIASENMVSREVMNAQASLATNKYAEGYPGRRYYAGCEVIDEIEQLAIDRAKALFSVEHVNVQPHAGAQANLAAMMAMLEPGETFMGLSLPHGGHLSHGSPVNISGRYYKSVPYMLGEDERLDLDAVLEIARKERPKLIITGYSAYSGIVPWEKFRQIADELGAYLLADIAHVAGLVAAGEYPSPVPYADVITTTTHKTLRGPRGAIIMVPRDKALAKKIDKCVFPGVQGGPMMHTICAKAVCFEEAASPSFKLYQRRVLDMAQKMSDRFKSHGFRVVSGGTMSHQFTLNVAENGLTGIDCESMLAKCGVLVNKNTVPKETYSPWVTSGIRIGTPAIVSRGVDESSILALTDAMAELMLSKERAQATLKLKALVDKICATWDGLYPV